MVDFLFDTNIYGKIAVDPQRSQLIEQIIRRQFLIHNFKPIREELRRTPKSKTIKKRRNLRVLMLSIYNQIASKREIPLTKDIRSLAEDFYKEYRSQGGAVGKKSIIDDLRIVACATLKGFDIIVSDDNRTMRSTKALRAYARVAVAQHNRRTPTFYGYNELKRALTDTP